jgi:hypothetical protein
VPLAAGDMPTGGQLALLTEGVIGRARSTTVRGAATSSTEDDCLRLDDVPAVADYCYEVVLNCHVNSTVTTDVVRVTIRYTTDGSTPTTASPILPGGRAYDTPSPVHVETTYVPAVDETLSLLVCVARETGSGTCSLYADGDRITELKVRNGGEDPGDTGVDL